MRTPLRRRRELCVGPLQFTLTMDERFARQLRASRIARVLRARPSWAERRPVASASRPTRTKTIVSRRDGMAGAHAATTAERVAAVDWYHVMDLPHGVVTPGSADHRAEVSMYGLPEDMRGMRALDVATFDGFWAFEMERRGADAVAIDIPSWSHLDLPLRWREGMSAQDDAPTGAGFRLAAELLDSKVRRREQSVYDISRDDLGEFDIVFISDLLQHLRDPQRALEAVYSVIKPGGALILAEEYAPKLEKFADAALVEFRAYERYTWWVPSISSLKLMLRVAGFGGVTELSRTALKYDGEYTSQKAILHARR